MGALYAGCEPMADRADAAWAAERRPILPRANRRSGHASRNLSVLDPEAENKENLANTTMETYLQDAPSSCMSCHASLANARGRDFAGILSALH